MNDYRQFLSRKVLEAPQQGIEPLAMPDAMKPHQADATGFALRIGRAGMYLDTGLGKSFCELEYSRQAAEAANGMALILTPLAVAKQFEREAAKFGYEARVIREQSEARSGINICNYDRLEKLDPSVFGSVVLDESSILKSFSGSTSRALRESFSGHRFRLSATATPAPNDHMELGQHAEFLGVMNSVEMLSRFFINDTSQASQQWRLKGHGEEAFWNWMASWACMAETPADFGHDAGEYVLPQLKVTKHLTNTWSEIPKDGLFAVEANATNMFAIKRETTEARVKLAASVIFGDDSWLGNLNTPQFAEQNINPTLQNASAENLNADPTSRMSPTCATTTNRTKKSSKRTNRKTERVTTPSVAKNTPAMLISESDKKHSQGMLIPEPSATGGSGQHSESPQMITMQSSLNNADVAPFAERIAATGEGINSASTIATPAEKSEDFSVPTAISASENFAITSSYCGRQSSTLSSLDWWVVWCDTNYEQDQLEKVFGSLCVSISGSLSSDEKEERYQRWERGEAKILLTKPSIFGAGMNMQHCCNMFFVGRSFSYEAWYQAVRRCWRFGQTRPVHVHLAVSEGEDQISRVIERKSADHIRMKRMMSAAMRRALGREEATKVGYDPKHYAELPGWLMAS